MLQNQHSFSIENKLIPGTDQPFGADFRGQFVIRRPSLGDKKAIALKDAASLNVYGTANLAAVGEGVKLLSYICIFVEHVAEAKLPDWFGLDKMYSDTDEDAIITVWEEVQAFLATFRPAKAPGTGGNATGEPEALVSKEV